MLRDMMLHRLVKHVYVHIKSEAWLHTQTSACQECVEWPMGDVLFEEKTSTPPARSARAVGRLSPPNSGDQPLLASQRRVGTLGLGGLD